MAWSSQNHQQERLRLEQAKAFDGLPMWYSGEESAGQCKRCSFDPWVRKTPWRRKWQPTPVFLPGKPHRQRRHDGLQSLGLQESDTTAHTHIHSTKGLRADRQTDVESSVNVFRECWVVARTPCPELTGSIQSLPAPSSPCLQMPLGQSQARSALPLLWVSGPESHLSGPSFLPELGGHLEDSRGGLI